MAAAEERLREALGVADVTGWVTVAEILREVDERELWKQRREPPLKSFSAWLRSFAQESKCSESLLWKDNKAAKFYSSLRAENPELPELGDAGMSARAIVQVEKLHPEGGEKAVELVSRVRSGAVRAKQLGDMVAAKRKVAGVRTSRHSPAPQEPREGDAALTYAVTTALAGQASAWIWGAETPEEAERRKREEAPRQFLARDARLIRTMTEFPVRVETGDRAKRIDLTAVTVENQTTADWMEVVMRGVEVKVSEHDLERDEKMADYGLFMDYMYIAVPEALVAMATDLVPLSWGVLSYIVPAGGLGRVEVVREPERLDAPRREEALMTAIVKLGTKN